MSKGQSFVLRYKVQISVNKERSRSRQDGPQGLRTDQNETLWAMMGGRDIVLSVV